MMRCDHRFISKLILLTLLLSLGFCWLFFKTPKRFRLGLRIHGPVERLGIDILCNRFSFNLFVCYFLQAFVTFLFGSAAD